MTFEKNKSKYGHFGYPKKHGANSKVRHGSDSAPVQRQPENGKHSNNGMSPAEKAERAEKSKIHDAIIKADVQSSAQLLYARLSEHSTVDFQFEDGRTPLTLALSTLGKERLAWLTGAGGSEGRSGALEQIVNGILLYGADVNLPNALHELPITLALSCSKAMVESLLEKGADPELRVDPTNGKRNNVPLLPSPFERLLLSLKAARASPSPAAQKAASGFEEIALMLACKFEVSEKSPAYPVFWQIREDARASPLVLAKWMQKGIAGMRDDLAPASAAPKRQIRQILPPSR